MRGAAPARQGRASGRAYLAGFERALAGGADLVLEMDSDFSHDPADLPRLIAAAGRRRPRARLALRAGRRGRGLGPAAAAGLSRGGSLVRADRSSACRCATSPAASSASTGACSRRIDLDGVHADGYGFQIELTYRAIQAGFSVDRGADRLPRTARGAVEDDGAHRAGGGLEGSPRFGVAFRRGSTLYFLKQRRTRQGAQWQAITRSHRHQLPG